MYRKAQSGIIFFLLIAFFFGLISAGCAERKLSELEQVVQKYNRLLPIAFESGNIKDLTGIVTETENHRIEGFIQYQAEQGKSIRAKLEKIDFLESGKEKGKDKAGRGKGYVKTREWWLYKYESKKGAPANPMKIYYEVRYDLVKGPKGWVIDKLNITKSEVPLTNKFNGRYISFAYPENLVSVDPEKAGFRKGDALEFETFAAPGQKEPGLVIVVKDNKEGLKPDYKRLGEEIKSDYVQLYPGTKVTNATVVKIEGKEWLKIEMEYTPPGRANGKEPAAAKKGSVKKTQYVRFDRSRIYWLTFALIDEASHAGGQDAALIEQIMKTVVLK
ncbi:MAG: hypothetical protein M1548_05840 [Actinobacteria bacterium]|nr:hypothetical protein [Actinomycetota bacterium]